MIQILLKPGLENFEHYFASMWDEGNCAVVLTFFVIAFLWDLNENWPFPVLWPLLSFPNLLTYWVQHSTPLEVTKVPQQSPKSLHASLIPIFLGANWSFCFAFLCFVDNTSDTSFSSLIWNLDISSYSDPALWSVSLNLRTWHAWLKGAQIWHLDASFIIAELAEN